jgi:predicted protein tyrosine phosphatase
MMDGLAPFGMSVCGLDELVEHSERGVSHVLSILDPAWPSPEVFGSYGEHERLELRFDDVIEETPGMIAPQAEDVARILEFGRRLNAEAAAGGANLLVHCHAGVSRSTASMALILAQALPDLPAAKVFAEVFRIRPQAWPNLRIVELGDALLGRGGALVAAVPAIYRAQLKLRPEVAQVMTAAGRGREVAAARAAAA